MATIFAALLVIGLLAALIVTQPWRLLPTASVPFSTRTPTATPSPPGEPTLAPTSTPTSTPTITPTPILHKVKKGETLSGIALKYGTTVEAIMKANNISDPKSVRYGQTLIIPPPSPPTTPTPTPTITLMPLPTIPTATLGPPYQAPVLLSPSDKAELRGLKEPLTLMWLSVGLLGDDEWYVVDLRYNDREGKTQQAEQWLRTTTWRLPESLRPGTDAPYHSFRWTVTVTRQTGVKPDGSPVGEAASPKSETWSFFWY
jgi:LysM repeat protein